MLVLIVAAVMSVALMTFISAVNDEGRDTYQLVLRARAREAAQAVAARLVATVNQQPWERALVRGQWRLPVEHTQPPFVFDSPEFTSGTLGFSGSVECVDALDISLHTGVEDPAGDLPPNRDMTWLRNAGRPEFYQLEYEVQHYHDARRVLGGQGSCAALATLECEFEAELSGTQARPTDSYNGDPDAFHDIGFTQAFRQWLIQKGKVGPSGSPTDLCR